MWWFFHWWLLCGRWEWVVSMKFIWWKLLLLLLRHGKIRHLYCRVLLVGLEGRFRKLLLQPSLVFFFSWIILVQLRTLNKKVVKFPFEFCIGDGLTFFGGKHRSLLTASASTLSLFGIRNRGVVRWGTGQVALDLCGIPFVTSLTQFGRLCLLLFFGATILCLFVGTVIFGLFYDFRTALPLILGTVITNTRIPLFMPVLPGTLFPLIL
jgi:hypothetical protein